MIFSTKFKTLDARIYSKIINCDQMIQYLFHILVIVITS